MSSELRKCILTRNEILSSDLWKLSIHDADNYLLVDIPATLSLGKGVFPIKKGNWSATVKKAGIAHHFVLQLNEDVFILGTIGEHGKHDLIMSSIKFILGSIQTIDVFFFETIDEAPRMGMSEFLIWIKNIVLGRR